MNNAVRPKLRKQIHDDVLTLLERHDPQNPIPAVDEPNYSEEGAPLWNGPSPFFWDSLLKSPDDLALFVAIMRSDFPSFCAVLVRIQAKRLGRIVPFFFNRGQVLFWELIASLLARSLMLMVAILKARQFGISTFVIVWDYWHTWRLEDEAAVLVADSDTLVQEFLARIGVIHDELPDLEYFKPELRQKSKRSRVPKKHLEYVDRRTRITTMIDTQVKVGIVGKHFLLSELAKYAKPEQLIEDLMPMLPPRGTAARLQCSLFVESTPRGKNYFYDLWQQAKARESEWVDFFLPWFILEDEYSVEPPAGWKPDKDLREFWTRCNHERMKREGLPVTIAQIYWYACELADADFDQDKMDRQYPTDDETCFLIGNDSVFRRQIRFAKQSVQDAEAEVVKNWALRAVDLSPPAGAARTRPVTVWRGALRRIDPNDPGEIVPVPDPFANKAPQKFTPLFLPMNDRYGKKITGPNANKGPLSVWCPPLPKHVYVIGGDPSGGVGADNAAAFVLDVCCGRQVAEFADKDCGPEYFADELCALGYWYNTALINPEIVGIGSVTLKRLLVAWRYPRMAHEEKWDEPGVKKNKYGVYMNDMMKQQIVMNLKYFLEEGYLHIASDPLLSELSTFEQWLNEKGVEQFGAEPPAKDDRVIAAGLACLAVRQSPKLIGYVKARNPLPTAADLGLNEVPGAVEVPTSSLHQDDPRRSVIDRLPQSLRDILNGMEPSEMVADPFEPIGGWNA